MLEVEQTSYDVSTRPTPIRPLDLAVFLLNIIQEICALSRSNGTPPGAAGFPIFSLIFWKFHPEPEPECDTVM